MDDHLDNAQRQTLRVRRNSWTWRTEWPTWLVLVAICSGWFGVAVDARTLGVPGALALFALLGAWYMSLQHELMHGHPTRWPLVNALLGSLPLAVWLPYRIYRESHLRHHDSPHLTGPEHDPESYFVSSAAWQRAHAVLRALLIARNTFAGRLLLGPAFSLAATARDATRKLAQRDFSDLPAWLAHGAALAALTLWLEQVSGIAPWQFIVGAGYPALALSSVRSFHEHRVAHDPRHRTVINEAGWFWRLLFLNNNYHLVHHDLPYVPWFALREVYEASRQQYIERSGGFLVKGYGEWLKRYSFARIADPVHGGISGLPKSARQTHALPRNPPGVARTQQNRSSGDILRRAQSSQRRHIANVRTQFRRNKGLLVELLRLRDAGVNRIHANAPWSQFDGERSGNCIHRRLASAVQCGARAGYRARQRTDVENAAAALQMPCSLLRHQQHPQHVDVEVMPELLLGDVLERHALIHGRIIDNDVYLSELPDCLIEQILHILLPTNVDAGEHGVCAGISDSR
jgi:fatty acid desaturase